MTFWPVAIAIIFLIIASVVFNFLPDLTEHGNTFVYVVGAVLVFYVGASLYLSDTIPRVSKFQSLSTKLTHIETVINELIPAHSR
jgi:uncharacterized membrane protein